MLTADLAAWIQRPSQIQVCKTESVFQSVQWGVKTLFPLEPSLLQFLIPYCVFPHSVTHLHTHKHTHTYHTRVASGQSLNPFIHPI